MFYIGSSQDEYPTLTTKEDKMLFLLNKEGDKERYPNGYWWLIVDTESHKNLKSADLQDGMTVRLENRFGGGSEYTFHKDDEIAEADDWTNLDWARVLLRQDSKYGFVSPDGRWYGCNYHDHGDLCKLVLGDEKIAENGWVEVYKGNCQDPNYYSRRKFLTEAQVKTLIAKGVEVDECDKPI